MKTRLLIDTDFEEEIFFSMSDKFLLTKKYFETEKIWKSSTNWLKLILRRKPFFTFSDQFLLTKGNKKLQSDNNLAPYDKFSHWLWKLAIFFMINLYLMFENCTLSTTVNSDWWWKGSKYLLVDGEKGYKYSTTNTHTAHKMAPNSVAQNGAK